MDLIYLLALVIVFLATLYIYLTWNYDYWQKQGIPYDKNIIPGLGNIISIILLKQNLASLCEKYYKKNKHSMYGFYQLTTPTLLVRDPELVKNILSTNFANFADNQLKLTSKKDELLQYNPFFSNHKTWKNNRVAISNAFSSKKLKLMFIFIQDVTVNLEKYLKKIVNDKYEVELKQFFNLYTGEIATTGIGVQGHNFQDEQFSNDKWLTKKALEDIFSAPAFNGGLIQVIFNHIPKLAKLMDIAVIKKSVDDFYREAVRNILTYRKQQNIASNDFLQIISDYVKTHDALYSDEVTAIASYLLSFSVEVYETTAMTLSFAVFQIAAHPQVEEKARKEIQNILKKHNGQLDYEIIKEFTYLEQIINESMRMNHVLGLLMKKCTKETKLIGEDGLSCTIKPGQAVVISTYGLQTDPNYWPEPEKFDPDRFNDELNSVRNKFAFLPFGEGPRICVGMRMAIITMKFAIIAILKNYSLELSPKAQYPLVRDEAKFLSAYEKGLWVVMKPLHHIS